MNGIEVSGDVLVRFLHVAACLSAFGACLFGAAISPAVLRGAPAAAAMRADRRLRAVAFASLGIAVATALVWVTLQAAVMSGAETAGETAQAVRITMARTFFGHVLSLRMALLIAAVLCLRPQRPGARGAWLLAALLSGAAVVLEAGLGHAAALTGSARAVLMSVQAVHVAAAGAWLGGLAPLAVMLATVPPSRAHLAALRFSRLGVTCVAALALTAWFNAQAFVGDLAGLLGTPYGRLALAKLALLLALLGFAAVNRFRFTPELLESAGAAAARRLRLSIAGETCIGLAIVFVAALLSSTAPGTHAHAPFAAPADSPHHSD